MEGTNTPDKIIVHHTADARTGPQFDFVNQLHQLRFNEISTLGFYVAYHLFIEKDGTVRRARADTEAGPHTKGHNFDSIAICLAGDFDIEEPTPQQVAALAPLIEDELAANSINASQIFPHRAFNATSCYGSKLADDWAKDTWMQYALAQIAMLRAKIAELETKLNANAQTKS